MNKPIHVRDGLQSMTARLGTMRDKAATTEYVRTPVSEDQLSAAYETSWLARKIIDVPALDTFRAWRRWQAEPQQIEAIEEEERRLGLLQKLMRTYRLARLYGACYLYFDLGDDASEPADPRRVARGGLRFTTVLTHHQISAGDMEQDPLSERYGRPQWYGVLNRPELRIHPSRFVILRGSDPDADLNRSVGTLIDGNSILRPLLDSIRQFDSAAANIASLIFESKIDVIKVKGLMSMIAGNPLEEERLLARYELAARAKGNNGMLLLDQEAEEYEQKNATFNSLSDIMDRFAQNASGAADIPITRLYGRSPGGLNATGDHDLRNYYDRISADQQLEIKPALKLLDECLIRSALGSRPPEVHYIWAPLWQIDANERASLGTSAAGMFKTLQETGLFPDEVLAQGALNVLTEDSIVPGLEEVYNRFFEEGGVHDFGSDDGAAGDGGGVLLGDDGSDQPRHPAGSEKGGQFASKEGGGLTAVGVSRVKGQVTDDHREAVVQYVQDASEINHELRKGNEPAYLRDTVDNLDDVLGRSKLKEGTDLYRGLTPEAVQAIGFKKDMEFSDSGFVSTSKSKVRAKEFAEDARTGETGYVMQIYAKAGTKALDVGSLINDNFEQEVLLPRGQRFRVVKVDDAKRTLYVHAI